MVSGCLVVQFFLLSGWLVLFALWFGLMQVSYAVGWFGCWVMGLGNSRLLDLADHGCWRRFWWVVGGVCSWVTFAVLGLWCVVGYFCFI